MATLTHIALHVRNIAACEAFYTDFCGLRSIHERRDPDVDHALSGWLSLGAKQSSFMS